MTTLRTTPVAVYRDASADADARARAADAPELREALLDLGFTSLGLLECRARDIGRPDDIARQFAGPDATLIHEALTHGEIVEILSSPDRWAFACVEGHFSGPIVTIRSLFEDGLIVDTTTRPSRAPHVSANPAGLPIFSRYDLSGQLLLRFVRLANGAPPLWPREHWPRAGYHLELVDTRNMRQLWERHRERRDALVRSRAAAVRAHSNLTLYLCIEQRAHEILSYKTRWQNRLIQAVTTLAPLLALLLSFNPGSWFQLLSGRSELVGIEVLLFILVLVLILSIGFVGPWLIRRYLMSVLPGLAPRPVVDLLREP